MAVAEHPTWAAAAAAVGVSPSALSQGLGELERRLGIDLFERDGRRRLLRDSAAPAVRHARQVIGLTSDLAGWAERIRTGASGRVRLGMIDAAAVVHLPEAVRTFRVEHPDVDVHLRVSPSAELLELLEGGHLDLAVCVDPPTGRSSFDIEPLLTEELAVYGPPGQAVDDVSAWGPWVLFPDGSHTRSLVMDALRPTGARLDVVGESHQPDVLCEMVRLGTGWTVLPRSQATVAGRPLAAGPTLLTRSLVVATRHGSSRDPAVDQLARQFLTAVSPTPPRGITGPTAGPSRPARGRTTRRR